MAISLKNHDDRIKALESKGGGMIKSFSTGNPGYVIFDNGFSIQFGNTNLVRSNITCKFAKTFNSILSGSWFVNCKNGQAQWECTIKTINLSNSQFVINNSDHAFSGRVYWHVLGTLTIYYIVRYNIYKLVRFLSHLNTKFGGERR